MHTWDEAMDTQAIRAAAGAALPEAHSAALRALVAGLLDAPIDWALTGSTSFALQGVPVAPNDIDVQTDAAGAYAIAARLSAAVVAPVRPSGTERIRSHFGALALAGVRVELMGDLQKRLPDGRWEAPVVIRPHRRWLRYAGLLLPVLDLAYEAQAYRIMGRAERADLLARAVGQGAHVEDNDG